MLIFVLIYIKRNLKKFSRLYYCSTKQRGIREKMMTSQDLPSKRFQILQKLRNRLKFYCQEILSKKLMCKMYKAESQEIEKHFISKTLQPATFGQIAQLGCTSEHTNEKKKVNLQIIQFPYPTNFILNPRALPHQIPNNFIFLKFKADLFLF